MKRGLPKDGSSAREVRIRRAASPSRGTSAVRFTSSGAAWWHPVMLWLVLLASVPAVNPRLPGDGVSPLASLRSVVIDHTLSADAGAGRTAPIIGPIGPSVLWSPFFLAAHAGVQIAQSRGSQMPADGLSWPYVWACAFGTAIYAFLALWLSYRLALRVAKSPASLLATLTIWLASSLPVYLYVLPFSAHVAAMFATALMLRVWLSVRDGSDTRARWFVWGLSAGLAIATSPVSGALLVIALIESVTRMTRAFVPALANAGAFLAGAAVLVVPFVAFEQPSLVFHWLSPQALAAAVLHEHIAFVWTPVLLLAVFGYVVAIRRQPALGATLLLTGAVFFYLGAQEASFNGPPYGSPFLVAITPVFVCGLAALIDGLVGGRGRVAWTTAASIAVLLVVWNFGWKSPSVARDSVIRYINDRKGLVNDLGGSPRE